MKLYATVTSERASKGQGGKELSIIVRNEKKHPCIALKVIMDITGRMRGNLYVDIVHATVESQGTFIQDADKYKTKGKKQKGECPTCGETENRHSDDACEPFKG